jgi:hypothetical protein
MIEMSFKALSPVCCSLRELEAFESLVKEGGEVHPDGLGERIRAAVHLGFVKDQHNDLVAVAAIKRPNSEYRDKVFTDARASHLIQRFGVLELGWAYTRPGLRKLGLCSLLTSLLLTQVQEPVFVTTRIDNQETKGILARTGFTFLGVPYQGRTSTICLLGRM